MDSDNKEKASLKDDANASAASDMSVLEVSINQDDTINYQTADEGNSSKYFSLIEGDSTLEIGSVDVTLDNNSANNASYLASDDKPTQNVENLTKLNEESVDKLQIHEKIDTVNILSGRVDIYDDNENSLDEHELVIDDDALPSEKSNDCTENPVDGFGGVVTASEPENAEIKNFEQFKKTGDEEVTSEEPKLDPELIPAEDTSFRKEGEELLEAEPKMDNFSALLQTTLPEGSSEVTLVIDDKNVEAIDIGEGVFIYKNDEGELTAIQITINEDGSTNFKCLLVGKNEDGNLEVYEEQVSQVPVTKEELAILKAELSKDAADLLENKDLEELTPDVLHTKTEEVSPLGESLSSKSADFVDAIQTGIVNSVDLNVNSDLNTDITEEYVSEKELQIDHKEKIESIPDEDHIIGNTVTSVESSSDHVSHDLVQSVSEEQANLHLHVKVPTVAEEVPSNADGVEINAALVSENVEAVENFDDPVLNDTSKLVESCASEGLVSNIRILSENNAETKMQVDLQEESGNNHSKSIDLPENIPLPDQMECSVDEVFPNVVENESEILLHAEENISSAIILVNEEKSALISESSLAESIKNPSGAEISADPISNEMITEDIKDSGQANVDCVPDDKCVSIIDNEGDIFNPSHQPKVESIVADQIENFSSDSSKTNLVVTVEDPEEKTTDTLIYETEGAGSFVGHEKNYESDVADVKITESRTPEIIESSKGDVQINKSSNDDGTNVETEEKQINKCDIDENIKSRSEELEFCNSLKSKEVINENRIDGIICTENKSPNLLQKTVEESAQIDYVEYIESKKSEPLTVSIVSSLCEDKITPPKTSAFSEVFESIGQPNTGAINEITSETIKLIDKSGVVESQESEPFVKSTEHMERIDKNILHEVLSTGSKLSELFEVNRLQSKVLGLDEESLDSGEKNNHSSNDEVICTETKSLDLLQSSKHKEHIDHNMSADPSASDLDENPTQVAELPLGTQNICLPKAKSIICKISEDKGECFNPVPNKLLLEQANDIFTEKIKRGLDSLTKVDNEADKYIPIPGELILSPNQTQLSDTQLTADIINEPKDNPCSLSLSVEEHPAQGQVLEKNAISNSLLSEQSLIGSLVESDDDTEEDDYLDSEPVTGDSGIEWNAACVETTSGGTIAEVYSKITSEEPLEDEAGVETEGNNINQAMKTENVVHTPCVRQKDLSDNNNHISKEVLSVKKKAQVVDCEEIEKDLLKHVKLHDNAVECNEIDGVVESEHTEKQTAELDEIKEMTDEPEMIQQEKVEYLNTKVNIKEKPVECEKVDKITIELENEQEITGENEIITPVMEVDFEKFVRRNSVPLFEECTSVDFEDVSETVRTKSVPVLEEVCEMLVNPPPPSSPLSNNRLKIISNVVVQPVPSDVSTSIVPAAPQQYKSAAGDAAYYNRNISPSLNYSPRKQIITNKSPILQKSEAKILIKHTESPSRPFSNVSKLRTYSPSHKLSSTMKPVPVQNRNQKSLLGEADEILLIQSISPTQTNKVLTLNTSIVPNVGQSSATSPRANHEVCAAGSSSAKTTTPDNSDPATSADESPTSEKPQAKSRQPRKQVFTPVTSSDMEMIFPNLFNNAEEYKKGNEGKAIKLTNRLKERDIIKLKQSKKESAKSIVDKSPKNYEKLSTSPRTMSPDVKTKICESPDIKSKTYVSLDMKTKICVSPDMKAKTYVSPDVKNKICASPDMKANTYVSPDMKTKICVSPDIKAKTYVSPDMKTKNCVSPDTKTKTYGSDIKSKVCASPDTKTKISLSPDLKTHSSSSDSKIKSSLSPDPNTQSSLSPDTKIKTTLSPDKCTKTSVSSDITTNISVSPDTKSKSLKIDSVISKSSDNESDVKKTDDTLETNSTNQIEVNMNNSISNSPLSSSAKRKRGRPKKNPSLSSETLTSDNDTSVKKNTTAKLSETPTGSVDKKTSLTCESPPQDKIKVKESSLTEAMTMQGTPARDISKSEDNSRINSISPFGKINDNIKCPMCFKTFRSENVLLKHVKHCNGVIETIASPRKRKIESPKQEDSISDKKITENQNSTFDKSESPKKEYVINPPDKITKPKSHLLTDNRTEKKTSLFGKADSVRETSEKKRKLLDSGNLSEKNENKFKMQDRNTETSVDVSKTLETREPSTSAQHVTTLEMREESKTQKILKSRAQDLTDIVTNTKAVTDLHTSSEIISKPKTTSPSVEKSINIDLCHQTLSETPKPLKQNCLENIAKKEVSQPQKEIIELPKTEKIPSSPQKQSHKIISSFEKIEQTKLEKNLKSVSDSEISVKNDIAIDVDNDSLIILDTAKTVSSNVVIDTITIEDSFSSNPPSPASSNHKLEDILDEPLEKEKQNSTRSSSILLLKGDPEKGTQISSQVSRDKMVGGGKRYSDKQQTAMASPMSRLTKFMNTKPPANTSIECEICGKTFRQLAHMVYHRNKHATEEPTPPVEQPKAVTPKKSIAGEEMNDAPVEPGAILKCEICQKGFRKLHHLVEHRELHASNTESRSRRTSVASVKSEPEAGFRCDTCDKSFRKLHHLVEHRELHLAEAAELLPAAASEAKPTPTEDATCTGCGKSFRKRHHMVEHRDIHCSPSKKGKTDENSSSESNIRLSVASSTSEDGNNCGICGKSYRKLHHMVEHRESHSEARDEKNKNLPEVLNTKDIIHECSRCYMVFPNENSLVKHVSICLRKKLLNKSRCQNRTPSMDDSIDSQMVPEATEHKGSSIETQASISDGVIKDEVSAVDSISFKFNESIDTSDKIISTKVPEPKKPASSPIDVNLNPKLSSRGKRHLFSSDLKEKASTRKSLNIESSSHESTHVPRETPADTQRPLRKSLTTRSQQQTEKQLPIVQRPLRKSLATRSQESPKLEELEKHLPDLVSVKPLSCSSRKSTTSVDSVTSRTSRRSINSTTSSVDSKEPVKKPITSRDNTVSKLKIPLRKSLVPSTAINSKTTSKNVTAKPFSKVMLKKTLPTHNDETNVKYMLKVEPQLKYKINPDFHKPPRRLSQPLEVKNVTKTIIKPRNRNSESALSGLKLPSAKMLQTILEESTVRYSFPKSPKTKVESPSGSASSISSANIHIPPKASARVPKNNENVKKTKKVVSSMLVSQKRKSLGGRASIDGKKLKRVAKKLELKCCGQVFNSQMDLSVHRKTHRAVRQGHKCDCGKAFDSEGLLKRHIHTEHTPPKSYKCGECGASVRTAAQFAKHKRDHQTSAPGTSRQGSSVAKKLLKEDAGSKVSKVNVQAAKATPAKPKVPEEGSKKGVKRKVAHGGVPLSDKMRKAMAGVKF